MNIQFKALPESGLEVIVNTTTLGFILQEIDGFYVFYPQLSTGGYWEEVVVRAIADRLEMLNTPIQKQLDEYFNSCIVKNSPFLTEEEIYEEISKGRV